MNSNSNAATSASTGKSRLPRAGYGLVKVQRNLLGIDWAWHQNS
jgi:hypothetical protein